MKEKIATNSQCIQINGFTRCCEFNIELHTLVSIETNNECRMKTKPKSNRKKKIYI